MRQTKEKVDQSAQTAQDFKKTVHVLLELLGRDMESSNPSRDRDLLIAVRDGLFRVEVSGQLFERIKAFREQLIKLYPECAVVEFNLDRHIEQTKAAAQLAIQPFSGKAHIREFFSGFGVDMDNLEMAIGAMTMFVELVRQLPLKFFSNIDDRLQTLNALQRELDEMIALEETQEQEVEE